MPATETVPVPRALPSHWGQLGPGLIAMMAIVAPQPMRAVWLARR